MKPKRKVYKEVFDKEYEKNLPEFDTFDNSMVVSICKRENGILNPFRDQIEKWFKNLPSKEKADAYARLRSTDDTEHHSAFWELLFHEYALREKWYVKRNPIVAGGLTPDFYMKTNDGFDFYLEVYTLSGDPEEIKNKNNFHKLLKEIMKIKGPFLFSVYLRSWFEYKFNHKEFAKMVQKWSEKLPYQANGDRPFIEINKFGINAKVCATYVGKEKGFLAGYSAPGGIIDHPTERVKRAISNKLKKYKFVKDEKKPFILAISADDMMWVETTLDWALYGQDVVSFELDDPKRKANFHKDNSGFITPNPGLFDKPQNTRLSAVILCRKKWNGNKMMYDMRVYHNPWATIKIPQKIFNKLPQYREVTSNRLGYITLKWKNENKLVSFK